MCSSSRSIKIVKRVLREFPATLEEVPEAHVKTERQSRREMFRIVTSWIDERKSAKKELAWPILR
jgi:hypothetical protein